MKLLAKWCHFATKKKKNPTGHCLLSSLAGDWLGQEDHYGLIKVEFLTVVVLFPSNFSHSQLAFYGDHHDKVEFLTTIPLCP